MKKLINTIRTKTAALIARVRSAATETLNRIAFSALKLCSGGKRLLVDNCGDLATNTIGGIIVAVVIIGLLVVAVNAFFPNFFTDMFEAMSDKLNANW